MENLKGITEKNPDKIQGRISIIKNSIMSAGITVK